MHDFKRITDLQDNEQKVSFDIDGYLTKDNYFVVKDFDVFIRNEETDIWEELRTKEIKRHYFNVFKAEELIMSHLNKSEHLLVEVLS